MLGSACQAGAHLPHTGDGRRYASPASAQRLSITVTTIPFVDLGRQHRPIQNELRAAFERVLGASSYVLGEEVARFEEEFAAYCGVSHCVGVASGTAALTIATLSA